MVLGHGRKVGVVLLASVLAAERPSIAFSFQYASPMKVHQLPSFSLSRSQQQSWMKGPQDQPIKTNKRSQVLFESSASSSKDGRNSSAGEPERHVRVPVQVMVVLTFYFLHLTVLSQKQVVFPFQLIPNSFCHFTGLGLDSLAGAASIAIYSVLARRQKRQLKDDDDRNNNSVSPRFLLAPIFSAPKPHESPWRIPDKNPRKARNRLTGVLTGFLLVQTYYLTGRFSLFWEDTLYSMSGLGFPITEPMYRSLIVLLGHLTWLSAGTLLLRWIPRPPKFFDKANTLPTTSVVGDDPTKSNNKNTFRWFSSTLQTNWLWWVIGGYFASACLFNLADLVNQYILPAQVLEDAQESLVSQLVNPEHNDILASAVGYIAPCISAPWWEEVLYRGFALPMMTKLLGYHWAVFLQGVIFSAHHMSLTAALPLAVLGWIWAIIYTKSQNLWVVIFIHSLWNSRVFLGSWLGL